MLHWGNLCTWCRDLDRRVIVADVNGEIVAVAANERTEHPQQGSLADVRYLMVFAVRHDQRRGRHAKVLAESVIAGCNAKGSPYVPTDLSTRPTLHRSSSAAPSSPRQTKHTFKPYASLMLSLSLSL